MEKTRVRALLLLCLAGLLVLGVVTLAGCKAASNTGETSGATTASTPESGPATTAPGTETSTPGGTPTSTPGGTAGGSTETTTTAGGQEAVAPVSDNFKICTNCHGDFNAFLKDSKVLVPKFSHAIHLNKGYKCEDCHPVPTHQPDKIVKPPMQNCFKCHSQEANAKAPGACGACHPAGFPLVPANHGGGGWLPPANPGLVKTVTARHADMAKQDRSYCEMCHAKKFCDDCHQVAMPHPSDWQQVHPQTVRAGKGDACNRCHPNQYVCNDCHHPGFQPSTDPNVPHPWQKQHPPIVKSKGAEPCFKCHNPLTCAHCHITGQFTDIPPKGQG